MEIPVYLFTGLLESGKTTLIQEVAGEEDFLEPGTTVLIQCEEGETPFSEDFLKKYSIVKIDVEDPDELNELFWKRCEKTYRPAQIMIEYNGMWELSTLFESGIPEEWFIGGIYSTVDASTAEMYISNMRKTFMEPLKESNLIIFNRCSEETDRLKFRRSLKALNPQVQVAFERTDGTMYENEVEEMPFDYSGQTVEIEDMDYGLWYLDAMDRPERYMGKEIVFTARYCASAKASQKYFVPGRHIMTCCEDDIQFLGFICDFEGDMPFEHGDWVRVTAQFDYGFSKMYGEEGPLLHLIHIEEGNKPEQELVAFT
ncbi:hypothetical protein NE619_13870 [Anaerovorax odorimutans]|uniref:DUF1980 domain-containing protein n=1 Tax=Anaerovorax odorimutans TaxID=109327 RepID=A0ABT1RRJ4_9FIRM|nr:GTP-binding protein [Anaerovorax odorimutans]MCQ4637818.1 hypothetical protein [Anaerovorax odorimutans]